MVTDPAAVLGKRLRDLRTAQGWTQIDLAEKSGVSRAYVSELETGKRKRPGFETIKKLADALKLEPSALTGRDGSTDERLEQLTRRIVREELAGQSSVNSSSESDLVPVRVSNSLDEIIWLSRDEARGRDLAALRVVGSDLGRAQPGDLVLVERLSEAGAEPDDVLVVTLAGGAHVKTEGRAPLPPGARVEGRFVRLLTDRL